MGKEAVDDLGFEDVFYNEFVIDAVFDAANSSSQEETEKLTSMDPFGNKAWAIHEIEIDWNRAPARMMSDLMLAAPAETENCLHCALGASGDAGAIDGVARNADLKRWTVWGATEITTTGARAVAGHGQKIWRPPTPIPFAAKKISAYLKSFADGANIRAEVVLITLRFTWIPTTPELWTEIYQLHALKD